MSTRRFFVAAAAALVALNFAGCKDDEEFDYTFENCVEEVANFTNIQNGDTICTKKLFTSDIEGAVLIKNGFNDVKGTNLIYIGTSKDNMRRVVRGEIVQLSPFTCYYLESVPCIIHDEDTIFGEKKELKFYSIPKHKLALTADYGDGEIAANIHWNLQYYYKEDNEKNEVLINSDNPFIDSYVRKYNYYDYKELPSSVKVKLIANIDTLYNMEEINCPINTNTCYIKQGGTRKKPDFPAYRYIYWKDGKTLMHYDPVIYDFCFDIKLNIGDDLFSVKDTIRSIFMDKNNCVCDYDFNIYRIAKIGNKIWTIDDYRGSTRGGLPPYDVYHGTKIDFYDYDNYLYGTLQGGYGTIIGDKDKKSSYIKGFHEANEDDWKDLMAYLGIEDKNDTLHLNDDICLKLENIDPSLNNYFSTGGNINELFSSYGWIDDKGNLTETYQGFFNAVPNGIIPDFKDIYAQGRIALFRHRNTICYIVSKEYGGIAKCYSWHAAGNVRFVKN